MPHPHPTTEIVSIVPFLEHHAPTLDPESRAIVARVRRLLKKGQREKLRRALDGIGLVDEVRYRRLQQALNPLLVRALKRIGPGDGALLVGVENGCWFDLIAWQGLEDSVELIWEHLQCQCRAVRQNKYETQKVDGWLCGADVLRDREGFRLFVGGSYWLNNGLCLVVMYLERRSRFPTPDDDRNFLDSVVKFGTLVDNLWDAPRPGKRGPGRPQRKR